MPRHDALYLADIVEAARDIELFLEDMVETTFLADKRTQAAVLQKLTLMGEAARQVSSALKERHAAVPWRKVVAFRNFAIHEYFAVDREIVWVAATEDAPMLAAQVREVWARET